MPNTDYTFSFKPFSKRVQMFSSGNMGVVVEKERDVVCVYGTDSKNSKIFCAVPLCHPRLLKGAEYRVSFRPDNRALVSVSDIRVYIDFSSKICSNNKNAAIYGSEEWGRDVGRPWEDTFDI